MIDMYFSRYGLSTNTQSEKWTACKRYDNFKRNMDHNRLQEQALTFALELKSHLIASVSEASIKNAVSFAFEALKEEIEKLEIALNRYFFECTDDFILGPSSMTLNDIEPPYSGMNDVGLILDTSIFAADDDLYQQQLAAALILQLDIWYVQYSCIFLEANHS